MIPKDCKRLAEVDFPIAVVSKHAAREKSIRHGHPSTLHLWWARRPLASSRAVLLGLLWPDPGDPLCPAEFKAKAREMLPQVQGKVGPTDEDLRKALLKFIGDFANWDLAADRTYLEVSRALVKAAHLPAGRQAAYEPPLVVDPFAGGGSIPLEALRVGCEAFASDLNPVACLILKVMLEDIPRHACLPAGRGHSLAEELRRVGAEVKRAAEKELADLYPKDPDDATPIAYLWARTVRCESPNCGAEIPLMRSFWLCKKANRRRALRHGVVRPPGEAPRVEFEVFEPKAEKDVPAATVTRAKATCVACGAVLPPERVRAQLAAQRGGADVVFDAKGRRIGGARMLAVVLLKPGETGRHYRLPTERDYEAVHKSQERLAAILKEWEQLKKAGPLPAGRQVCPVPDEPLPPIGTLGFRVQRYGMVQWGDLFTARQKVALRVLQQYTPRGTDAREQAVTTLAALSVDKCADLCSSLSHWKLDAECPLNTFTRHALPINWDFAEAVLTSDSSGSYDSAFSRTADGIEASFPPGLPSGQVQLADATAHPLPDDSSSVWFTDPPYYDAIPYADLSDYFFVWLKRALPDNPLLRDPFDPTNLLTPKASEAVQDESKREGGRLKDRSWFEETMARAFAEGRRVLHEDGVGSVVFAHKTTEGWEALLSGLIRGRWTITSSWPIATELAHRIRARESAALGTSVHLICRPRPDDAAVGDWADVLRELPKRIAGDLPAPRRDKYYVYVLKCADDSFYIGQTDDVRRRFGEHQAGKVSWTKARQPLEIIHWEEFNTREEAVEREQNLKTGFGRQWLKREYEKGKLAARQAGWMERLQGEGVRGADLVFACIGPALEIFSRYSKVETADGREVKLDEYLQKVWEVVGRTALEQVLGTAEAKARNGAAGAVEEDARLTALFLWTLQSTNGEAAEDAGDEGGDEEATDDEEDDEETTRGKAKGFTLVFDVVRRFAQPLGIELPKWEGRVIETKKGVVRLLPVAERAKQLFGEDGAQAVAARIEENASLGMQPQLALFPEEAAAPSIRGRGGRGRGRRATAEVADERLAAVREATTLDRVHAAMLLQAGGRTNALRTLLKAEKDRGPEFERLANALSALYPKGSEEKRLLDAMLLAVPR